LPVVNLEASEADAAFWFLSSRTQFTLRQII
jgi:hypothetical protein